MPIVAVFGYSLEDMLSLLGVAPQHLNFTSYMLAVVSILVSFAIFRQTRSVVKKIVVFCIELNVIVWILLAEAPFIVLAVIVVICIVGGNWLGKALDRP
jgi:chromate transport protein ChrA